MRSENGNACNRFRPGQGLVPSGIKIGPHDLGPVQLVAGFHFHDIDAGFVDRQVAELIQYYKGGFVIFSQLLLKTSGCLCGRQVIDGINRGAKVHGVPL